MTDLIEDERSAKITENAVVRTFQVFWVVFCAFSIGAVMDLLYLPQFSRERFLGHPPGDPHNQDAGIFPAGTALPDDLPLCRLPDVLCQKIRGLGNR